MKNLLYFLLYIPALFCQTTINYEESFENFSNPERGMVHYTFASNNSFPQLTVSQLNGYRLNENMSIVWRCYQLDAFRNSDISSTYLQKITSDLQAVRAANFKIIIRFSYGNTSNDATKSRIISHINQLKTVTAANEDVILNIEAGFIAAYGEWYASNNFGTENLTNQNYADRYEVATKVMELSPNRPVSFRTPEIKRRLFGYSPLNNMTAYNNSSFASRSSSHNDCAFSDATDYGTYINITEEYAYLEEDTKYGVMGGEACNISTYSSCENVLDKMAKFHWSYLNKDYNTAVLNYWENNGCMDEIERRLGYRFVMQNSTIINGSLLLTVNNEGFGNAFSPYRINLIYRNNVSGSETVQFVSSDVRWWQTDQSDQVSIPLLTSLPDGEYQLLLEIKDPYLPSSKIRFANIDVWESSTGYNKLNQYYSVRHLYVKDHAIHSSMDVKEIKVFNLLGQVVENSDLKSGIYVAESIYADNKRNISKLIVP